MRKTQSSLHRLGALAGVVLVTTVPAAPAAVASAASPPAVHFELPQPTGPYRIGVTDLHLVDHTRNDPWVQDADRELMVTIRYPALGNGRPLAPFMTPGVAKAAAEADASALKLDPGLLEYDFLTHSRTGAAAVRGGGRKPIILYSPGRGVSRSFGTTQMEQLASKGYVVVAIDHTHEAVAVEFPGGRVARPALPPWNIEVAKRVLTTRVQDTRFVLDQLEVLASGGNPDAEQRQLPVALGRLLDLSRVGMFGHSAGGFTSGETMVSDRRIDAGADLDGSMAYSQSARDFGRVADEGLDRPFLLMSAGDHSASSDPSWQQFLSNHRGWRLQLHVPAGEHFTYTDHQTLLPQLITQLGLEPALQAPIIGNVSPARSVASQRAYLTAYFDEHLRQRPQRLLNGPSPQHPDVQFLR